MRARRRARGLTWLAVALVHAALLSLLLIPGRVARAPPEDALLVVAVPEPEIAAEPAAPDEASAPDLAAEPPPITVPEPDIRIIDTPLVVAAPAAATGSDVDAGAAVRPGPGTGAGGSGTGVGGGGIVRARWASGSITRRDYPRSASRARAGGSVTAHFDVAADGRVQRCRVVRSSGNADLDATTCRLIEQRFRYTPARNAAGEAVPDIAGWKQDWWLEPDR